MGSMWCMVKDASREAETEAMYVELPVRRFTISEPLTEPENVVFGGDTWEKYEAVVMDPVTVWRRANKY